jgi:hypothetical protein
MYLLVLACGSKALACLRIIKSLARPVRALFVAIECVVEMTVIAFPKPRFVHIGKIKDVMKRNWCDERNRMV